MEDQASKTRCKADIEAIEAITVAMIARLQGLDPATRILLSQILEEACRSIEDRARNEPENRSQLFLALNKIEAIHDAAMQSENSFLQAIPFQPDSGKIQNANIFYLNQYRECYGND